MTLERKLAILKRMQEISGESGSLTPEAVVADAADPTSVLHDHFEWDDAKAGHQHRLDQARGLIRIKMATIIDEVVVNAPSWVRTPEAASGDQGYTSVTKLRDNGSASRAALMNEIQRIISAHARARALAVVLGLEAELSGMIKSALDTSAQPSP